MCAFLKLGSSRAAALAGVCALALTQAACAHPVVVEPSVVVQARLDGPVYGSIYAPPYGASPVWVAPAPLVVPYGAWAPPGHRHRHGHGRYPEHEGWGHREGFRR